MVASRGIFLEVVVGKDMGVAFLVLLAGVIRGNLAPRP